MAVLPFEAFEAMDEWIAKFPPDQKQSAVLQSLRIAQEYHDNYLTTEVMDAVAKYLDMPKIAVYEVASFYSMYNHEPVGKHQINVCNSISCKLNGSDKVVDHLEKTLGIRCGQTTADKRFTLKTVGCLGACVGAPMFQLDKDYHERLTPEKIDDILAGVEATDE